MASSYTLGTHFEGFVKQQVASGRYNNASEVVRTALRLLEDEERERARKQAELVALIEEGIRSGDALPAEEVFAELKQRYASMTHQEAR